MTGVPNPWVLLLLGLAAWRSWTVLATDEILDGPRQWCEQRFPGLGEWLRCPYCAGFWVCVVWWAGWWVDSRVLVAACPFALSVTLIAIEKLVSDKD